MNAGTVPGSGPISDSDLGGPDSGLGTTLASSNSSLTAIPAIAPRVDHRHRQYGGDALLNIVTVPPW